MRDFRPCLKGLVCAMRPCRMKMLVSILIGMVGVAASLAFVWISKRVVDIATGNIDASLDRSVAVMVAIMVIQVTQRVAARYWEGFIVVRTQNSMRADSFAKVIRSAWDGRDKFHSGDMVNRLEEDIRVICDFICVSLPDCIVTLCQLLAATFFLFHLAPNLAWILIFIMPVAVVGSRLFFKKMRRLTGEIRALDSQVQGHMQENIQHRILIKVLGCSDWVLEKMGFYQSDLQGRTIKRLDYAAVSRAFMQVGFAGGYLLAFLWGVYGLRDHTVTYGLMVAFLQLVGQVQRPVAGITQYIPAFIRALSSEERIMELQEMPQEDESLSDRFEGAPGIRVRDLTFAYPDREGNVLEHLDYDFKPGTMTAILGSTGAGKSTLIKVILALLQPSSGSVRLYDSSRETDSCVATRCNFMYVPQGNSLMSGTIRENLLLANADASDDEIGEVLHLAAADFVFDLKAGLDTPCSEVGRGLSEGQAQRIAIARALLRPGGILILDEATSALDGDTELELLERLNGHYQGRKTILCITHRPAATSFADSVLRI